MKLTTCLLPSRLGPDDHDSNADSPIDADIAVVIDVLRATSVMVTALDAGATRIVTCREVVDAWEIAETLIPRPLLCGERGCRPIDGFDLGNSPAEYTPDRVQGQTLVLTTTNGTRAIASVESIARVVIASFLNLSAVVDALRSNERVHLVCAGTEGHITLEDVLLAGAIIWKCQSNYSAELIDDDSVLAVQLWRSWFADEVANGHFPDEFALRERLRETRGGKNLLRLNFDADLGRCARIDVIGMVPMRVSLAPVTFAPIT